MTLEHLGKVVDGRGVLIERDEVVAVVEAVLPLVGLDGVIEPGDRRDAEGHRQRPIDRF